jgi:hypothetical protein
VIRAWLAARTIGQPVRSRASVSFPERSFPERSFPERSFPERSFPERP